MLAATKDYVPYSKRQQQAEQEQPVSLGEALGWQSLSSKYRRLMFDYDRVRWLVQELLLAVGENPEREGLQDTPRRVADWWREFMTYDPGQLDTTFDTVGTSSQMVVLSGVRVYSLCEHHLLPFWCDVSIAYIADKKLLGLSKLARIAHQHAHKLQVQERLVSEIASSVAELAQTGSVAVLARGEHLCMSMRGIRSNGLMTSSVMLGAFDKEASTRAEFLSIIGRSN